MIGDALTAPCLPDANDIPSKIESRVLAEQLALVLANTRGTLFMAAVLAPIVWYLLRPSATPFAMDGWSAALSLGYFLRFLVLRAYQRCDRPEGTCERG
ncbi:MAG: hypothetical protein MZU95_13935 [Desulfomicrobium escambiense]|nr:hypothetical protein [Desulfomicrobium escambiense]